jgi:hypothetical protein
MNVVAAAKAEADEFLRLTNIIATTLDDTKTVETYSRISLLGCLETYSRISLLGRLETYGRISV